MADGPRRRLQLLIVLLIGLAGLLVAQLVKVQIVDHRFYTDWGREQRERRPATSDPPRGVVRDRNGHLLIGNSVLYSIEASTAYVVDVERAAAALGPLLHLPAAQIAGQLRSDTPWIQIAAPVPKETGEQIAALELPGITVRPMWRREYPEGRLAAHVLGFCNAEGRGFYGIEGFHDALLRPKPVERTTPVDSASEPVPWTVVSDAQPQPGDTLILTIDRTIQAIAEAELLRSVTECGATGGTVIVMDPRTFEILALASLPNYDPGRYGDFYNLNPPPFADPAISQQYEPGSVFKIVTMAAALDSGLVTPETMYHDAGWIEVGGVTIRNAFGQGGRDYSMTEIMVNSLNVGAAWLATRMGADTFYHYVRAFGIGRPTGVDLAGEVAGRVWLPDDYEHWHEADLGTNSFGQGLATTPLQMITAVATVANEGVRLRPHIVARRITPSGQTFTSQPMVEARVISTRTARWLTEILVRTVDEGGKANVPGYRIAGKSGTAQIPVPGGYDKYGTIVSFAGYGPADHPQIVILIKLDRPQSSTWAGETAAPAFQRLMSRLLVVMGIPPGTTQPTLVEDPKGLCSDRKYDRIVRKSVPADNLGGGEDL